jgi:hypothetical protein
MKLAMRENETEFGKICIEALARLTADEERALLPGMTAADIEAARDQAKSQYGMTRYSALCQTLARQAVSFGYLF